MQLSRYLSDHAISYTKFARLLNVSPITVYRWIHGLRFPSRHLSAIAKATNGKVTANDFVALQRKGGAA
jgi:DNA-binding transcriptional regulator YdaS (Cro superfamily)